MSFSFSTRVFLQDMSKKEEELLTLCANPSATKDKVRRIEQLVQDPGVNVNCVDTNGNSALLWLCRMNRCDDLYACIEALLQSRESLDVRRRIDINHQNKQGWNALLLLCRYHSDVNLIDLFHLLIQHGINLSAKTTHGWTALLLLSRHYDNENLLEVAKLYLKHNGDDGINCRTDFGTNSLSLLSRYYSCGNLRDVMKLYLDYGIDVNCKNNDNRNALLILSQLRGSDNVVDCVKVLVEHGTDIACTDHEGRNALHFLCSNYYQKNLTDLVSYLTFHSPLIIRSKTISGITALEALSRNWSGIFHSLLHKLSVGVELDDQSLGRIILNASLLGCFDSVVALMPRLWAVPIDNNFKDPSDHLEEVVNRSFSLCRECRPITLDHIKMMRTVFSMGPKIRIQPALFKTTAFTNEITYNDRRTYRQDGRDDVTYIPSFQEWLQLCSAWHEGNTISMEKIDYYLRKHSHPQPSNHLNCNWCQVADDVDIYLVQILDKIKEIDPLFEVKQFHKYGSSAEKTDVFLPSESDRLVVLKHFRQSPYNPKEVVYAGTCPETDSPLKKNEPINSSSLLLRMAELVKAAVDCVSSIQVFGPIVGFRETCVTIHSLYRGRYPPAIKGSCDLTIAVEIVNPSNDTALPDWCGAFSAFLVPFRQTEGSQWQKSYPTFERDLILKGGDCVAKVCKLLKFFVALHRAKEDRKEEIQRKSCPSSYALKTCVIRYMISHPLPWQPDDIIQHVIGILKHYPMDSSELKSFFDQDQVVYEVSQKSKNFVSEIIDKLENFQG